MLPLLLLEEELELEDEELDDEEELDELEELGCSSRFVPPELPPQALRRKTELNKKHGNMNL